jgi:hypothetical protein
MNGSLYQLSRIVVAVKKALNDSSTPVFDPLPYDNKIEFRLLPEMASSEVVEGRPVTMDSWFQILKHRGLTDIKLSIRDVEQDRFLLGFANSSPNILVCRYQNGSITCFSPYSSFDSKTRRWDVLNTEQRCDGLLGHPTHIENNIDEFRNVLMKIRDFAVRIGSDHYGDVFQSALNVLSGSTDYVHLRYGMPIPQLPLEHLRLFEAAAQSDVFGAMGSWNDDPSGMAESKGLGREYETLSAELLKQNRIAIQYAVNEW